MRSKLKLLKDSDNLFDGVCGHAGAIKGENRRRKRQRAALGYADCDVWEMRYWFVKTLKPMLIELSQKTYDHPEEITFEEWQEILLCMADRLTYMDVFDDSAIREKLNIAPNDNSQQALIAIDAKITKAKNEFFELFNKWFFHLWY